MRIQRTLSSPAPLALSVLLTVTFAGCFSGKQSLNSLPQAGASGEEGTGLGPSTGGSAGSAAGKPGSPKAGTGSGNSAGKGGAHPIPGAGGTFGSEVGGSSGVGGVGALAGGGSFAGGTGGVGSTGGSAGFGGVAAGGAAGGAIDVGGVGSAGSAGSGGDAIGNNGGVPAAGSDTGGGNQAGAGAGGTDSNALVAECQARAQNFATQCAGDDQRPCLWAAYSALCQTGNTELLVDAMKCLDASTCRTFSDPNESKSCLDSLHAAKQTATARAYYSAWCTTCGGSNCIAANGTAEVVPYLNDTDVAALTDCAGTACSLGDLVTACASVPGVEPFAACFAN